MRTGLGCAAGASNQRIGELGSVCLAAALAEFAFADYLESDRPAGVIAGGPVDVFAAAGVLPPAHSIAFASTTRTLTRAGGEPV